MKQHPKLVQPAPDDNYLREYSGEHLWHEVWMFFQTGAVLPGGVASPVVEFIHNAVLEAFAIHLRNLLDFFYPGHVKPDDVIAAYYYDAGHVPANFPTKSRALEEAEVRAHKQVSHLTTKRVSGDHPDKRWYVEPLMNDVAKILRAFIESASRKKLDPGLVERTKQILGDGTQS